MGVYYPQIAVTLDIMWEDFNFKSNILAQKSYSLKVLAKRVNVHLNDYTHADTFDMEIDYKNFPFDPRAIRACGVTISLEDMQGKHELNGDFKQIKPNDDNTIFVGFADEESITLNDTARTVKLEGRDYTAILIDRKYTSGTIDLAQPLDFILIKLFSEIPEFTRLIANPTFFDNRVKLITLPVLAAYTSTIGKNPQNGTKRSQIKDESYWDVIQDLVSRAGLIAYMELDRFVITNPRTLYDANKARKFVYGKNIKNLEFKRQLGRKKNFNIQVISLSLTNKITPVIEAVIPKEATIAWSLETGIPLETVKIPTMNPDGSAGTPKEAPTLTFRIDNVVNKEKLIEQGEKIYEELGRQQIEGSFSTRDMEVPSGGLGFETCSDVLKIRIGTPISIKIDQADLDGINSADGVPGRLKYLLDRCYDPLLAQIIATTLNDQRLTSPFYTKAVHFSMDAATGLDIKIDFLNFIELPKGLGISA